MTTRVVVLGAGFGGLELSSVLSEALGAGADVTLIDKRDAFVFGFSKLDLMFGKTTPDAARLLYRDLVKPGVRFRQEKITAIDPASKRVTTSGGTYEADVLVVALGAGYDVAATPGLAEGGHEFYSVEGALKVRALLPSVQQGRIVIGVCGAPYKCPPAASEAVLLLHSFLTERGVRSACELSIVLPAALPVPPSPAASQTLIAAFAEAGIRWLPGRKVSSLDPARRVAVLDDGSELPYDLFLGIPKHCVPAAVATSGLAVDGWVPVNPKTLETRFPGVYAIGDVTSVGTPKAGTFAEGAARTVAAAVLARLQGGQPPRDYEGRGSCYVEFGSGKVGRVDVDFLSGPKPTGAFQEPSEALADEKAQFSKVRRARWFGP